MAKWGNCNFEQLKQLRKRLEKLENMDLDSFCREASKELAARLLALVIPRTPVGKKPKLTGEKSRKIKGVSGKSGSFLTAEAVRLEQYWGGYIGGTLRRGWTAKTHEEAAGGNGMPTAAQAKEYAKSLPVQKAGHNYRVYVINPVKWAGYVEFGHRQTPGIYVPALGKSLKSAWVNGQYFLTISEEELNRIAPAILQRRLDEFLREVF